jgi:hypothetical protein
MVIVDMSTIWLIGRPRQGALSSAPPIVDRFVKRMTNPPEILVTQQHMD